MWTWVCMVVYGWTLCLHCDEPVTSPGCNPPHASMSAGISSSPLWPAGKAVIDNGWMPCTLFCCILLPHNPYIHFAATLLSTALHCTIGLSLCISHDFFHILHFLVQFIISQPKNAKNGFENVLARISWKNALLRSGACRIPIDSLRNVSLRELCNISSRGHLQCSKINHVNFNEMQCNACTASILRVYICILQ